MAAAAMRAGALESGCCCVEAITGLIEQLCRCPEVRLLTGLNATCCKAMDVYIQSSINGEANVILRNVQPLPDAQVSRYSCPDTTATILINGSQAEGRATTCMPFKLRHKGDVCIIAPPSVCSF